MKKLKTKPRVFVGIDPGKAGFIVAYDGDKIVFESPIPYLESEIDPVGLLAVFDEIKRSFKVQMVCLENQAPFGREGAKSIFNLGQSFMGLKMALIAKKLPFSIVTPQKWKKEMKCNLPRSSNKGLTEAQIQARRTSKKKKLKELAIRKAQEYLPGHDFRLNTRCRNPHDGKCEAALIAVFSFKQWSR